MTIQPGFSRTNCISSSDASNLNHFVFHIDTTEVFLCILQIKPDN